MKTLYHYCSTSSFLSIIKTRSIRLSSLTLSNDSKEGKILSDTLNKLFEDESLDKEVYEQIRSAVGFLEEIFDGLGFCLSEVGDLLSQWRGYANDGGGFSIGFSKKYLELLKDNLPRKKPKYQICKVLYDRVEHQKAVKPIYDAIKSVVESGKLCYPRPKGLLSISSDDDIQEEIDEYKKAYKKLILSVLSKGLSNLFSLKSEAFVEEKEWRLISYLIKDESDNCSYFSKNNKIVPYRIFPLIPLELEPISEVIIGPKNITPDFVVDGLLNKYGYKGVKISRSKATYR